MHRGGAAGRDGHAAVVGAEHHRALRLGVIRIEVGPADVREDQLRPCQGKGIAEHGRLLRGVALHHMGKGVHARRGHDRLRQAGDRPGIKQDVVRDHRVIDDALLRLLLRDSHDRVAGRFSAGPAGGGDHRGAQLLSSDGGVVHQVSDRVGSALKQAHQLGRVHHAAAAHGDDEISVRLLDLLHHALNVGVGRLRLQIVKDLEGDMRRLQLAGQQLEHSRRPDAAVREHEHLFRILFFQNILYFRNAALTRVYAGRHFRLTNVH